MTEHYDAIIVGSGADGGTLAHTLARSGKRILLERGDFLTRDPALTAMANAIRVGEHLLSRMS